MARCDDCIHYEVCDGYRTFDVEIENKDCADFADASRFVELPCKVGDTVYFKNGKCGTVRSFYWCENVECGNLWISIQGHKAINISATDIGKTAFLTREEAEKALAERRKS